MMFLQGVRRLLESFFYTSVKSASQMWIGHYILGLLFYLTINIAIWIETIPLHWMGTPFSHWINISLPSYPYTEVGSGWLIYILPPAILTAQALQHTYHAHLYHLRTHFKTYQLPYHPFFPNLICPHYTCEVVIYLLLSILGAPGRFVNHTLLSGAVFVAVNLGVTASGTKEWYVKRFGKEKVGRRWRMVPGVW